MIDTTLIKFGVEHKKAIDIHKKIVCFIAVFAAYNILRMDLGTLYEYAFEINIWQKDWRLALATLAPGVIWLICCFDAYKASTESLHWVKMAAGIALMLLIIVPVVSWIGDHVELGARALVTVAQVGAFVWLHYHYDYALKQRARKGKVAVDNVDGDSIEVNHGHGDDDHHN